VWAMYQAEAGELARQAGGGNLFIGKAKPDLTVGPKEAARFAKSLDDAVGKVKAASPAKPAATPKSRPTSPKAPKAPKPAVDPAPHVKVMKSAFGKDDAAFQKSLRSFLDTKPKKDVVTSVAREVMDSSSTFKTKTQALKALADRHVANALALSRANVIRRTPVALALGLGVTAAMAMMGRSSSAEAKPAAKPEPGVSGAAQRSSMPTVMAQHPNRSTASFYDQSTLLSETSSPLGARAADKVQGMYAPAIRATGDVMARRAELRASAPRAPSGPGMAMGVAKAARAAPAAPATGGGRRPAAAPDPSGKTRTGTPTAWAASIATGV